MLSIIWLVLFTRLLIPLEPALNPSPFSLMGIDEYFHLDTRIIPQVVPPAIEAEPINVIDFKTNTIPARQNTPEKIKSNIIERSTAMSWFIRGIAFLWLTGVILMTIKMFTVYCLFKYRYKKACIPIPHHILTLFTEIQQKLHTRARLVISSAVHVPCVIGLLRPTILFPAAFIGCLDNTKTAHILLHELVHIKRKDIISRTIITLLGILYWFHPLLKKALDIFKDDQECACDADSLTYLSNTQKISYGRTILRLLTILSQGHTPECTLGIMDNKQHFTRRLLLITQHRKKTPPAYIISAVIFITVTLFFTTKTISAEDPPDLSGRKEILFSTPVAHPRISLEFGWTIHPLTQQPMFHNGMDMKIPIGTPISAISEGKIIKINREIEDDYGLFILIEHSNGFQSLYSKLSNIHVEENQQVKKGQVIGLSGNSGMSTGPHLHFMIFRHDQPVNPREFIVF